MEADEELSVLEVGAKWQSKLKAQHNPHNHWKSILQILEWN